MALLGKNFQNCGPTVFQTAAANWGAAPQVNMLTLRHSLRTTPDIVLPIIKSVYQACLPANIKAFPPILQFGGNGSLVTVAAIFGSSASAPTVLFDCFAGYFHSIIR